MGNRWDYITDAMAYFKLYRHNCARNKQSQEAIPIARELNSRKKFASIQHRLQQGQQAMTPTVPYIILLLIFSNLFMTFAWYAHLKLLDHKALWIAILFSWGIAFFEYIFQVPANRLGFNTGAMTLAQLKILQEIITLVIFAPFAFYYMRQPITWNFAWAGLCMVGAVYFMFR